MDSVREIENLIYQSAWMIDEGKIKENCHEIFKYCTVTIPDTSEEILGPDLADIAENTLQRWGLNGDIRTSHRISNLWIEVDDEAGTAESRCYLMMMQAVPQVGFPLQAIGCGVYHDTFKRIDDQWWYATHRLDMKLMGDMSRHAKVFTELPLWQKAIYRLTMMFPFLQRFMPPA